MIYKFIYNLFEKKLETLKEYIKVNLKKEFIRLSKLLVKYLIIFILKINKKLRLYVDYK